MKKKDSKNLLTTSMVNGTQSNYVVTVTITPDNKASMRNTILLEYQKDATKPGFRKGHVPLPMVEQMLNPGSLMMASLEEFVQEAVNQVVSENADKQWIGQPYNLNMEKYGDDQSEGTFSFVLDVYPSLVEKDTNWKKAKKDAYSTEVTSEEVNNTLTHLRSSYAQFEDAAKVEDDVLTRVKIVYKHKDMILGNPKNWYLGWEDLEANADLKKILLGKKTGDVVEVEYKKVEGLTGVTYTAEGDQPTAITMEIIDTKKKVLPPLDQEFIDKVFTKEDNISSIEELTAKVKETLSVNKDKNSLFEWVNDYLTQIDSSFDIIVPQTLIDEEMKNRLQHLSQQMGGDKGLQNYIQKMGEEKSKAYLEEIKQAGVISMRKFFIIKHIADALDLAIDWTKDQEDGEIEKKLYEKLVK